MMSNMNVTVAGVRVHVQQILNYATNERKRGFVETVELQVSLTKYGVHRDKRFSGVLKLPSAPRPRMDIWSGPSLPQSNLMGLKS